MLIFFAHVEALTQEKKCNMALCEARFPALKYLLLSLYCISFLLTFYLLLRENGTVRSLQDVAGDTVP